MTRKQRKKKAFIAVICVFLAIILILAGLIYKNLLSPSFGITQPVSIYVDENKDFNDIMLQLKDKAKLKNPALFQKMAEAMNYPKNIKTGKYDIEPNMNCLQAVRMMRNGIQSPVKLTFNNARLKSDLAEKIGGQMMFGSGNLLAELDNSQVCSSLGFDTATITAMFIPNTYEVYWNIPVEQFLKRMKREYERFWTEARLEKAKSLSLSPIEVSILASIVEEETASKTEYPMVAGLYINRLRKGMLLQADPTVKFAVGDFALRRILFSHLEVDSPYNTYKYAGLPPGPIRVPSAAGIDGVLNYSRHNYLYMAAKEDFSGQHNFAVTLAEHNRNARRYQQALNSRGIR
ncbi:MAG: endolytic transglycosylase MltG [Dysgonamonadaceae bacterium]|jgi:UPF0755 protein|nr:endolytic transglycosylase MltG [Dysgonamonadaceae bacterium]